MTSVSTDRRQGVNAGSAFKVPVRVATTAALAALSGLLTVDGVVLASSDRVLVKNQVDQTTNGIYDVATGAWTRAVDADGTFDLKDGSLVQVSHGTVNARLVYVCTAADTITIGTSNITFAAINPGTPITTPLSVALGGTGGTTQATGAAGLGIIGLTGGAGTANAQTAAAPSTFAAFALNNLFEYVPPLTNTAAVTITVTPAGGGALAARNIFYDGAACAGGELVATVPTLLLDDGTRLHIVGYSRKIRGSQLGLQNGLINGTIVQTRAGSAETIAVKTLAGADPSAADPVGVIYRNATVGTGDYTVLWLTAALSLTISSGSTGGVANSVPFRLWYAIFNDAGTARLAAINCLSTVAGAGAGRDVTAIYPLGAWGIASSTAEGGAGAADSSQTFYTGVAVSAKAFSVVGYATWEAGLAAAGTWGTAPTRIQLFGTGVPLPGTTIQVQRNDTGAVATGTTTIPADDTIPQNTEGDQYMTQAITPSSAANVLNWKASGIASNSAAGTPSLIAGLFQDAVANAIKTIAGNAVVSAAYALTIDHQMLAAGTVAITGKMRIGSNSAGTTTFNGATGVRGFGGSYNSYMQAQEIMG